MVADATTFAGVLLMLVLFVLMISGLAGYVGKQVENLKKKNGKGGFQP
jgi:hypothetical protein